MQDSPFIVVNMFAGPNAGKTGVCHGIMSRLKQQGMEVDTVLELARFYHYTQNAFMLKDELHLLADKNTRLNALKHGGIKIALTDGPILASMVYRQEDYLPSFDQMCREAHAQFHNINLYIPGVRDHFSRNGRGEVGPHEALTRSEQIRHMLNAEGEPFIELDPSRDLTDQATLIVLQEVKQLQSRMEQARKAARPGF
jgi:hypothetical protein